jgi:putative Mg2+ transporter-C (MgtC) family protein
MLLGALIGIERELADKPAGIRTNMLVAGSATLLVSLGEVMIDRFEVGHNIIRADPIRIIEAVITGISFIGAGMIIRRGTDNVEGLTTAASILFVASVGICVAISQILLAIGTTILALITLGALGYILERYK